MLARVSIYDSNYHHHALKRILWKTYVHAVEMENYWVLDFEKQDPPVTSSRNWTWMDATAYFVPFFRDSNHIFATLHETGPLTFGQIQKASRNDRLFQAVSPSPLTEAMEDAFTAPLDRLEAYGVAGRNAARTNHDSRTEADKLAKLLRATQGEGVARA